MSESKDIRDDRFDQILQAIQGLGTRMDKMENKFEGIEAKMQTIENKIEGLATKEDLGILRERIENLESKLPPSQILKL